MQVKAPIECISYVLLIRGFTLHVGHQWSTKEYFLNAIFDHPNFVT